jgi:hypothetical protein
MPYTGEFASQGGYDYGYAMVQKSKFQSMFQVSDNEEVVCPQERTLMSHMQQ